MPLKELKINIHKLDEEIIRQPQLYYTFAIRVENAVSEKKIVENELEVLKNRLEKKVRKNPKKYGIDGKPTEGAIKSVINNNKKIRQKTVDVINLSSNERMAQKVENALKQKQRMLEALVKLKTDLWYSDVKTTHNYQEGKRKGFKNEVVKSLGKIKRRR